MNRYNDPLQNLKEKLLKDGYFSLIEIPGKGLCGLFRFIYTTGLCIGLNEYSYEGRYCFKNGLEALHSLNQWDGTGDPPGDWVKFKSMTIEYQNPKLKDNSQL
jgi:hypothetical protein